MTEKDQEIMQNAATVQIVKARKTLATAQERLRVLKEEIKKVSAEIQRWDAENLASMGFTSYEWWNPEVIQRVAGDVLRAQSEIQEAEMKARNLGAILPD